MERFFGGNPGLVLVRLVILSLVVGVLLAAFGFSPFDIIESIRQLAARIYGNCDRERFRTFPCTRATRGRRRMFVLQSLRTQAGPQPLG
jgi:hypothetical protein